MVKRQNNSSCKNVSMKGTRTGAVKKSFRVGERKSSRQNESRFAKKMLSKNMLSELNAILAAPPRSPHTNTYSNSNNSNANRQIRSRYRANFRAKRAAEQKKAKNAEAINELTAIFGRSFALAKPKSVQSKLQSKKGKAPARRKAQSGPPTLKKYLNLHEKFMQQKPLKPFTNRQKPYLENSYNKCLQKHSQLNSRAGPSSMQK